MNIVEISKGNDLIFSGGVSEPLFIGQVKLYAHGSNKEEILKNLLTEANRLIFEIENKAIIVNDKR